MASDAPGRQIGLAEFGIRFVHAALTADRIKLHMATLIGPLPEMPPEPIAGKLLTHTETGAIDGVEVTELTPNPTQPDAAYEVVLNLRLHIALTALGMSGVMWDGNCSVPIVLTVIAQTPLDLVLGFRPVIPADVSAALSPTNWFAGNPWVEGYVHNEVVTGLAKKVNDQLTKAYAQRHIDVGAMIRASDQPVDPNTPPAPNDGVKTISTDAGKPTGVVAGDRFVGDFEIGGKGFLSVHIDPSVQIKLSLAARLAPSSTSSGGYFFFKLLDNDNNLIDNGNVCGSYIKDYFQPEVGHLYGGTYAGAAIVMLIADESPMTLRGSLTFEPKV